LSEAIFANVRLNQKIADHCKINELFIILNMGDAGLSLGATMSEGHSTHRRSPIALDNAFVGPNINEDNALHVLNEKGWRIESDASPMNIAELLSKGAIIAQCQGRREVGSRVLVNRSILANPAIPQIVQRLNHSLNRSDFMTFAHIIAEESIEGVLQWKPIYQHGC
jgi:carbamoyltransferase